MKEYSNSIDWETAQKLYEKIACQIKAVIVSSGLIPDIDNVAAEKQKTQLF